MLNAEIKTKKFWLSQSEVMRKQTQGKNWKKTVEIFQIKDLD